MARKNRSRNRPKRRVGGGGGGGKSKSKGGGGGRSDSQAVRSIVLGMGIIGLIAAFFLMPISGKPAFNHLLDLFPDDGAPTQATGRQGGMGGVATEPKGAKGQPMETVTDKDQADLDNLIKRKAKNK